MKKVVPSWRSTADMRAAVDALNDSGNTFIVFDTETTGLDSTADRIIEFSGLRCVPENGFLRETGQMDVFIHPSVPISPEASKSNGITNEDVAGAPSENEAFPGIRQFMAEGTVFVGQNVKFDIGMVSAMYGRYGESFSPVRVIDTMMLAKQLIPDKLENYQLSTLAEYFGFADGVRFHLSSNDIVATRKLFEVLAAMAKEYIAKEPDSSSLFRPDVFGVGYWQGPKHNMQRIYVETSVGSVFYDIWAHCWKPKNAQMDLIDMEHVQSYVMRREGFHDLEEMERLGRKKCAKQKQ